MRLWLLTMAVAALVAAPTEAAWRCYNAAAFEVTTDSSIAIRDHITTSGKSYTQIRMPNSEAVSAVFLNTVVPADMPDAMELKNFRVTWSRAGATSGNGCFSVSALVIKDGQSKDANTYPAAPSTLASIPSGTNLKVTDWTGVSGMPFPLEDVTETQCSTAPATCRLQYLRFTVFRNNALCSSNADGDIALHTFCFEY